MPKNFDGTYTTTQILSNPTTDNRATVTSAGLIEVNSTAANAAGIFGGSGVAWTLSNLGTVVATNNTGANATGINLGAGGTTIWAPAMT